jgi:hypothetical protein
MAGKAIEWPGTAELARGDRCGEFGSPKDAGYERYRARVFVAGTSEESMGTEWRGQVVAGLEDLPIAIVKSRLAERGGAGEQRCWNPQFRSHVKRERAGLDDADVVLMYLGRGPACARLMLDLGSLVMERLGNTLVVCCPEEFELRGDVEMMAERQEICLVESLDEMVAEARSRLKGALDKARGGADGGEAEVGTGKCVCGWRRRGATRWLSRSWLQR